MSGESRANKFRDLLDFLKTKYTKRYFLGNIRLQATE